MQRYGFALLIAVMLAGFAGLVWWAKSQQAGAPADTQSVISRTGLHAHPELRIFAQGAEVVIPSNIGLGAVHQPMHTHDDVPIIHLEFSNVVRRDDIRLGRFFEIWEKDFYELGSTVTMTVNGVPNTEFTNYEMKDGDKIELRYE